VSASAGVAVTPGLGAQSLDDIGGEPGRVAPAQQREAGDQTLQGSGGTAAVGALVDVALDAVALHRPELSVEILGQPALVKTWSTWNCGPRIGPSTRVAS